MKHNFDKDGYTASARKLTDLLKHHGYEIRPMGVVFILRDNGQPMMNKAFGEVAPTWELRCDALHHHGRLEDAGDAPEVWSDGRSIGQCEIGSYLPLGFILKQPKDSVQIKFEDSVPLPRLAIYCDGLPESWTA